MTAMNKPPSPDSIVVLWFDPEGRGQWFGNGAAMRVMVKNGLKNPGLQSGRMLLTELFNMVKKENNKPNRHGGNKGRKTNGR